MDTQVQQGYEIICEARNLYGLRKLFHTLVVIMSRKIEETLHIMDTQVVGAFSLMASRRRVPLKKVAPWNSI